MANEKLREAWYDCKDWDDECPGICQHAGHPCRDALLLAAANEPKVQARILRAAARYFENRCDVWADPMQGEYDAATCGRNGLLADAIEKGDVKLEVRP